MNRSISYIDIHQGDKHRNIFNRVVYFYSVATVTFVVMLELVTTCQMWFLFFISSQSWLHCIYNEIQYFHDSPPHLTLIECFAVFLFPNWDLGDSCQFAAQIGSSVGQMPGSQRHRCHSGLSRIKCDTCHPRLIYLSDSDMTMLHSTYM